MTMADPPHALDLVINFVNTLDIEAGTDALSTPHDLAAWLTQAQLLATSGGQLDEAARLRAVRLREALRALMLANNGATTDEHTGRELERAARAGELGVHFTDSGTVSLAPGASGLAGALARLLIPFADGLGDGSWQRVKACRSPDCQWAFYDRSRNHSGVWCDMAICGNRTKVRAYRDRAG
jgi:predicted RNA-binding Zn ribbon-like protein